MNKNSLNYIAILVILYSIYDYFEHILRPGSIFEENPFYWLFFNIAAIGSLLGVAYGIKYFLEKVSKKKNLLFEVLGIASWLVLYLNLLGPIINKLFWPFNELLFSFSFGPFFIILTIFFIIRMMINLVLKRAVFYSV